MSLVVQSDAPHLLVATWKNPSRVPTSVLQRHDDAARRVCALPRQPPDARDAHEALRAALAGL